MARVPAPRAPKKVARSTNVTIYLPLAIIREADARAKQAGESRSTVIKWVLENEFELGGEESGRTERGGTP